MTTSHDDGVTPLSKLAAEPAEESVRAEAEVVGDVDDEPDTGGTVPDDGAQ
jgi:hypothetical protein